MCVLYVFNVRVLNIRLAANNIAGTPPCEFPLPLSLAEMNFMNM